MKKRKVCAITGTRAEYGLLRPVMTAIKDSKNLELVTIATGMHLLDEFGSTWKEIEKDGFSLIKVPSAATDDSSKAMAESIGDGIKGISKALADIRPDIILLLGDRSEILAAAIAGVYQNIPIAHIHGGDRSHGGIDESARHAITKLAHIHFAATAGSAERIRKLGEDKWRIHVAGAPGLDSTLHEPLYSKDALQKKGFPSDFILVVQHPNTYRPDAAAAEMQETLEAIKELKMPTVLVYPNADAGGRAMIEKIRECERLPFLKAFKSLDHKTYLSLLKYSSVLVGNSSSGIIEAPSFRVPVVNIGDRQKGRERSTNIIDVPHKKEDIIKGIKRAQSAEFQEICRKCVNPYGDGTAAEKIASILETIDINKRLIGKQIAY